MKILFITATRLGDAVLSSGLLDHLLKKHPGARTTIACGPAAAPLFEDVPNLERLIVLKKRVWSLHWLGFWGRVGWRKWDVLVDLRRAPVTYLIPSATAHHLGRNKDVGHRVLMYSMAMNLRQPASPVVWMSDARRREARRAIADDGPVLAIGPGANWPGKVWRPERFAQLVERLTGPDGILPEARVALFGTAEERAAAKPLIQSIPPARRLDLMGKPSLLTVGAVIARCALYIGNDSGLMHLAAAVGTPTLGLFGPSPDEYYAPWGDKSHVVRTAKNWRDYYKKGVEHRTRETMMDSLSVDDVEQAARRLWKRVS